MLKSMLTSMFLLAVASFADTHIFLATVEIHSSPAVRSQVARAHAVSVEVAWASSGVSAHAESDALGEVLQSYTVAGVSSETGELTAAKAVAPDVYTYGAVSQPDVAVARAVPELPDLEDDAPAGASASLSVTHQEGGI